jgi:hypothetical protein
MNDEPQETEALANALSGPVLRPFRQQLLPARSTVPRAIVRLPIIGFQIVAPCSDYMRVGERRENAHVIHSRRCEVRVSLTAASLPEISERRLLSIFQ